MAVRQAYLKQGKVTSWPASTGKVRVNITEMIRRSGLSVKKVLGNNGLLDEDDCAKAEELLSRNPRCGIRVVYR